MGKKIFVVDDEENIRELIKKYLEREGYKVYLFASIEDMLSHGKEQNPDMYILDIMLPGLSGLEFCKNIRNDDGTPIIFVSAKDEELDRILGLELGGDDYLSKPFSPRELVARIKSVFRRFEVKSQGKFYKNKDLTVYIDERRIEVNESTLDLTNKEYDLMLHLIQNINIAFTREQLLNKVWGYDYYGDVRAVDDLIKRLRKKLHEKGSKVEITTIWGYGYKLDG